VPIYEFVCEACGRLTEVMQRMSDPPPATCPECGAPKLARLVSRTSFQLKGGGWYSDLYASPKKKPEPGKASGGDGTASAAAPGGSTGSAPGGPASSTGSSGDAAGTGSKAKG
jgi:putative FmdB family regulatory protein